MPTRHKSIRIKPKLQKLITARMLRDNCDESAAMFSLMMDGAGVPQLRPLSAQVASAEHLSVFCAKVFVLHQIFMKIRSRIAMALPDPDDKELCALVEKWRKTSADLEQRLREIFEHAEGLAKTMTGLTKEECRTLQGAKKNAIDWIGRLKKALANPEISEKEKLVREEQLSEQEAILHGVELLGF